MMGEQLKKYTTALGNKDKLSLERYRCALEEERSKRAEELARRAEKLRLLYKVRFEEDLRAFIISHNIKKTDTSRRGNNPSNSRVNNVGCIPLLNESKKFKENGQENRTNSFVPTWAWPASLRNSENIKLVSLFYTAETGVPLSPTQVGGSNVHLRQLKTEPAKRNSSKPNIMLESKKLSEQKSNKCPLTEMNKIDQRQKLRLKYGAPFSWIRNLEKDKTEVNKSPIIGSSDVSTPQSHLFTEIPKQPSIYPSELQFEISAINNSRVSEFIKKTRKMQRTLERLLDGNQREQERKFNVINTPPSSEK
ncbi:hypothetical protein HWI79_1112 [Cryptosporidium felis]|nr:hypothetical protein HWI79_1112 [Cryptosporidium felis]